jgi:hypothetical protein
MTEIYLYLLLAILADSNPAKVLAVYHTIDRQFSKCKIPVVLCAYHYLIGFKHIL